MAKVSDGEGREGKEKVLVAIRRAAEKGDRMDKKRFAVERPGLDRQGRNPAEISMG